MKAKDLRIGNYVLDGVFDSRFEIQIEQIEDLFDSKYYEPIPLTEEWLLKFGFSDESSFIENHYIIKGMCIWKCNDLLICNKNGIVLKQVHQLQNLYFALTNEELTIKQ